MARIGLRVMPTFPSSLKSRAVGFPQYDFEAIMSDRAFLNSGGTPFPTQAHLARRLAIYFALGEAFFT
jgi:hypothetical protein